MKSGFFHSVSYMCDSSVLLSVLPFLELRNSPCPMSCLFIQTADEQPGHFHFLVIITDKAAMNIRVQLLVCTYIFISLGQMSRNGIAGPSSACIFNFIRSGECAFK